VCASAGARASTCAGWSGPTDVLEDDIAYLVGHALLVAFALLVGLSWPTRYRWWALVAAGLILGGALAISWLA
jgi:lipoprotein signal peptidase